MKSFNQLVWRNLLEPVVLAALVTWLAIFLAVQRADVTQLLPWTDGIKYAVVLISMFVFLAIFVGKVLQECEAMTPGRWALTCIQLAAAWLVVALSAQGMGPILLIILMADVATSLTRRQLIFFFFCANIPLIMILRQRWGWTEASINTVSFVGFQLFAVMMTVYARRAEAASSELQQVNAHLLATRTLLAESARDQERLRISRELHDVAGHKLTAMKLHMAALRRDDRVRDVEGLEVCAQLTDELLGDIRGVVKQMRAHDGMSLRQAIEQITQAMPKPKAHIDIEADAAVRNALQAEALLRAIQETITNAARHGAAENIWIRLRRNEDRIELDVRDDGRGSAHIRFGSGLSGMRERMEALGGAIQPDLDAKQGFALHAWIPLT